MKNRRFSYRFVLIPLIGFVLMAFGLILDKLGIYWDDWAYTWTRLVRGYHGLLRHFSFSRPVAGQIHNIALLATDGDPLRIQIWGLLFQVFGSFWVGALIRRLWPGRERIAAFGALLFLAYPGFTMRPIAINFSFSYFLIGMLCISFILTLRALRPDCGRKRRILFVILSALLALLNLFASEYFFLLELLRPFMIWIALTRDPDRRKRFPRLLRAELPCGGAFLLGLVYRMFFNRTQTAHYDFSLIGKFKTAPLTAIGDWFTAMCRDCFRVSFGAWAEAFNIPDAAAFGSRSTLLFFLIAGAAAGLTFLSCLLIRRSEDDGRKDALQMIAIGLLGLVLGGQPFWLTESRINLVFPNCRYTLPFMLGVTLILTGLLLLIPGKRAVLPLLLTALLVGFGAGHQFVAASEYRRDYTLTKDFFRQLKWRIPAIEENTVVVTNALPIRFSTDNSLTAPLNWIYADSYETDRMPYMLYTNTKRENTLSGITAGHEIFQEYLTAQFSGNTDDMISVYFNSPGCVHVLDPEVDVYNQTIPELDREAAVLNNYARIRTDAETTPLPVRQFGSEPADNWCRYYESADLARQTGDWERAALLGDEAFRLNDHPNDPMERIPFIESYAHVGRWQDALAQSDTAFAVTPLMNDPLCAVWNRIDRETDPSAEKESVLRTVYDRLDCTLIIKDNKSHE